MIPYGKQQITRSDVEAVERALSSPFLTTGPALSEFEEQLASLLGSRFAVACSSGTAALHLACLALEMKPGDLGVTSPITFLASANCFEFCGARTDFVDIDRDRLCLSPSALERYCEEVEVPKAVVTVDFAGVPSRLEEIRELSKRYGFSIVCDAAHSLGSTFELDGRLLHAGDSTLADMTTLSFHPVKAITTGEGGAVLTNDELLAKRLRGLRFHGIVREREAMESWDGPWSYEMRDLGYNYRITDIQCALGLSQLVRLPDFKERRAQIVRRYNATFASIESLEVPPWPVETSPCFHLYPLRFREGSTRRRLVYDRLAASGIQCQVHYIPVYWQPYYSKRYGYQRGKCPESEAYYGSCLSLPIFPELADADVDRVAAAVIEALSEPTEARTRELRKR